MGSYSSALEKLGSIENEWKTGTVTANEPDKQADIPSTESQDETDELDNADNSDKSEKTDENDNQEKRKITVIKRNIKHEKFLTLFQNVVVLSVTTLCSSKTGLIFSACIVDRIEKLKNSVLQENIFCWRSKKNYYTHIHRTDLSTRL